MNIADIKFNSKPLPLQQDTIEGGEEFGCPSIGMYKMLMSTMTGNNKMNNNETGGTPGNSVKVEGDGFRKFEPIFILKKGAKPISIELPSVDVELEVKPIEVGLGDIDPTVKLYVESEPEQSTEPESIQLPSGVTVKIRKATTEELENFVSNIDDSEDILPEIINKVVEKIKQEPQPVVDDSDDDWFNNINVDSKDEVIITSTPKSEPVIEIKSEPEIIVKQEEPVKEQSVIVDDDDWFDKLG
jgi:hypothetical protein